MGFKWGKCPHRPHLFMKPPAWNRGVIDSFHIFPPRKALRTRCTLACWHRPGGVWEPKKIQCTCDFNCLCKLHLSSKRATAVELKGSTTCRNLKTLEAIQRILLTNNKKTSMHLFFLSPVLNTSYWDCWLRVKQVSKVPLCSKCIPNWQHNTLLQQMPGDGIKVHKHVWTEFCLTHGCWTCSCPHW